MASHHASADLKSHFAGACFTWLLTSLFYGFQLFLRSSPNAIGDALIQDFGVNAQDLGWLTSMYYVSYSLLQVPLGIALDMWGPKIILRIGTVVCVLGTILFVVAPTFNIALLGRMIIGMGAAASFIGSIRMSTLWFAPSYLAFSIGLLSAFGKCGGALANKTLPHLMASGMTWQSVIWLLCAVGAILAGLICIFLKNGPDDVFQGVAERPSWQVIQKETWRVLTTPTVWAMGLYGYSMYLVLSVFSDTYSINFLVCSMNISKEDAGSLSSWAPIGSAVGASLISFLSDRFQQRRLFLRLCSCATLCISSMVFFGPPISLSAMRGLLLMMGIFSSGQILIFAIVAENFSIRLTGIATGITNALMMSGGVFHNPIFGALLSFQQDNSIPKNDIVYTLSDYRLAFSSLTVCFIAASIISFFVKESHPSKKKYPIEPIN